MMGRRRLAGALTIAGLALGLTPAAAPAQVFIASKPHPDFWIAPLLITANIAPKDVAGHPGRLTLQVSFCVAPPPASDPSAHAGVRRNRRRSQRPGPDAHRSDGPTLKT